jgi:hypothetical protein
MPDQDMIREATVMELEQLRSKKVQVTDHCCRGDINSQLPLVFDCHLQASGSDQDQLLSFWWTEVSVHGSPETDQLDKHGLLQFTWVARFAIQLPGTELTCERMISTLEARFFKSRLSAGDDLIIAQIRILFHELWDKPR